MQDVGAVQLRVPSAQRAMDAAERAARALSDDVVALDPPHVSLGWPWSLPLDLPQLRAVTGRTSPFVATLDHVAVFDADRHGRRVVHLALDDVAARLVRELATALGHPLDADYRPHVSLVRLALGDTTDDPDGAVDQVVAAAREKLPGPVTLDVVEVSARRDGRWSRVADLPLGADH